MLRKWQCTRHFTLYSLLYVQVRSWWKDHSKVNLYFWATELNIKCAQIPFLSLFISLYLGIFYDVWSTNCRIDTDFQYLHNIKFVLTPKQSLFNNHITFIKSTMHFVLVHMEDSQVPSKMHSFKRKVHMANSFIVILYGVVKCEIFTKFPNRLIDRQTLGQMRLLTDGRTVRRRTETKTDEYLQWILVHVTKISTSIVLQK